tara:strand:+ start:301 stop:657 length:357 start_codon:yes stop_codon:yes gene_type:complete
MNESLGKIVNEEDQIIKNGLENLITKENNLIHEYKVMNDHKNKFTGHLRSSIIEELEKRKLIILYKMQSNEEQYKSLIKIIDYLTFLDNKKKNLDIENIRNKLLNLEKELIPYKELFQ